MPNKRCDWSAIRALAVSGIGLAGISRRLGIPRGTITARASREGWEIAQTHGAGRTGFNLARTCVKATSKLAEMPAEEILEQNQALGTVSKTASTTFGWSESDSARNYGGAVNLLLFCLQPHELRSVIERNLTHEQIEDEFGHRVRQIDPRRRLS